MTSDRSSGATSAGGTAEQSTYENTSYEGNEGAVPVHEETVEPRSRREETVVRQETRPVQQPVANPEPVNVDVLPERRDGVRWGPIWAGLLTALSSFLLLELLFYGLGWLTLDPGQNQPGSSAALVTGILALVAFFLGGLIAGATAMWKGLSSGLLHGFLVWALGVVAFLALTFFGGGALLGSFGSLAHQFGIGPQQIQRTASITSAQASKIAATAKSDALPAFFGLLLPLITSMLGGLIGSKMWPRQKDVERANVY
jgi:hypothetical protein